MRTSNRDHEGDQIVADSPSGPVHGVVSSGVVRFSGIPYAEAPVGPLRFMSPQAVAPWTTPLDASRPGPIGVQAPVPGAFATLVESEGIPGAGLLNLNIWTPGVDDRRRPVIIWIHGGGFAAGAGSDSIYDGSAFARDGVVFVTFNYRLGIEGFLYLSEAFPGTPSTGSQGVEDQAAALAWVHANIAAFGGDPDNITVAGQSAGAYSVATLLGLPMSRMLIRRAILQSGAADKVISRATAAFAASQFLDVVGEAGRSLESLQALPAQELFAAQSALIRRHLQTRDDPAWEDLRNKSGILRPVWGTPFLPHPPLEAIEHGAIRDVDLLLGTNADENQILFVEKNDMFNTDATSATLRTVFGAHSEAVWETYSARREGVAPELVFGVIEADRTFRIPTIRIAEAQLAAGGAAPHMYEFAWPSTSFGGRMGAFHLSEVPFVFDSLSAERSRRITGDGAPQALADAMHAAWLAFATSGDPGVPSLPSWPSYDEAHRSVMRFDAEPTLIDDPLGEERAVWNGVAL